MSQVLAWILNSFTAESLSPVVLYYFGTYVAEDRDETTQGRPGLKMGRTCDSLISESLSKLLHSGGARGQLQFPEGL